MKDDKMVGIFTKLGRIPIRYSMLYKYLQIFQVTKSKFGPDSHSVY